MPRLCAVLIVCLVEGGCAALGGVNDGTSLAYGALNEGLLIHGIRLPEHGDGYRIPPSWVHRGSSFGTDELVSLVVHAARRVDSELPGSKLYVADLSPMHGGWTRWHRSHQNGRDADLLFFAVDEKGRAAPPPDTMPKFDPNGHARMPGRPATTLTFDIPRNWALVRALLEAPDVDVQYLFISEPLKQLLLTHATAHGEPLDLIEKADAILHQPEDSAPHDDHLHLRIHCPASDRSLGCREQGPMRWLKKSYKYRLVAVLEEALLMPIRRLAARPFCRFLARRLIAAR